MTITFATENVNNYNIYIEQDKYTTSFKVGASPIVSEGLCGFPVSELVYPTYDKAKRRYNYLRSKARKGEL